MASRILHGPSSSKNAEKKLTSTLPRPSASKRNKLASSNGGDGNDGGGGGGGGGGGVTSATGTDTSTGSSRLPQSSSTSFFGRHKGKGKEKTPEKKPITGASSSDPKTSASGTTGLSPKKLGKAKTGSDLGTRLAAASTIPRGLAPGMGVTTKITAGEPDSVISVQQQPPRLLRRRPSFTNSNEQQKTPEYRSSNDAPQQEASSTLAESVDYESEPEHEPEPEPEGPASNTVFGITISEPGGMTYTPISRPDYSTPTEYQTSNSRMELYMSKRLPHKLSTQNLPPSSTLSNSSSARDNSSTSSRFTETPSPFSRISTPNTSTSLHSPQVQAPKLTPPRLRPIVSPTKSRPPVVRRKMPGGTPVEEYSSSSRGLSSVRENNREVSNQSSSSSSNSTIKASDLIDPKVGKAVLTGKLDREVQPTAPLRTSSKRLPKPLSGTNSQRAADKVEARVEPSPAIQREGSSSRIASTSARSPPSRPSRIGAPRVASLEHGDSPIVQSNLSHVATSGHTRRESMERALTSPDRGESGSPRRWLSKSPPKEVASLLSPTQQQPPSKSRSSSKSRQTAAAAADVPRASKRDHSPASTTSATRSRFGLFSRRIKSPEEPPQPATRKGPAAGTGHEAYGKFGRPTRGRSGSVSSTGSREKSSSPAARVPVKSRQSSFASNDGTRPNKDDFFEQRLRPVVISGGGTIKSNRNSQNGIGASVYASSSAQSSVASISSSVLYDKKTNITSSESSASILSSAMSEKRTSRSLLPAPKITSKSDASPSRSLAHRRSQQKISQGEQPSSVRIPAPIDTHVAKAKPVLDSRDTMQSSLLGTSSIPTDDLSESHWLRSGSGRDKGKSRMKSPRRWNIFSRARSRSPKKASSAALVEPALPSTDSVPPVSVSIKDMPKTRFVGHYALMEDEGLSSTDDKDIDNVLKDIEDDLELRDEDGTIITSPEEQSLEPRQPSMLLPSPPKLNAEFPRLEPPKVVEQAYPQEQPYLNEPLPPVTEVKRRPSRLQRVGRIPNQYTHRPNQSSFSRPFDASGLPSLEGDRSFPHLQQSPSRPKLRLQTESLPQTTRVEQWRQATYATAPATNAFLYQLNGESEFMSFASERQSLQMSQSSSSGNTSFINAVTQRAQASRQQGDEMTTESELGDYADDFDLDSPEGEELLNSFPNLDDVRRVSPGVSPNSREAPRPGSKQSNGSKKSVSPPLPDKPDHLSVPPHLHPATQPHNKSNSSEIFSDYNRASARQRRGSNSSSVSDSRYSSQTTISSSSHVSALVASPVNQVTRAMARKTHSARESLRFSALMTSRWLSFDRVLFSPVAEDILSFSIQAPRILILDGLANDDWSAYTALSYPNATVYNLSTTPKLRTPSPHGDEWANPPNHKLLPLPSTAHPFPFPKGFFAAVVVRFPPLLPQHHLNNVIAEARRVLRPGGYLEMALLDIDPVNLGPRTRKEVRRVKMQAQQRMPDAGLAPVGDSTMKLLSRRGFEGLKTAVLNVPVATTPDIEAIEGPGPLPFNEQRVSDRDGANKPNRTLGDLLREAGDESGAGVAAQYPVAQTVSRVARWWWSRCYEGLASVDGNDERGTLLGLRGRGEEDSRSMWADPTVIEECEERGTNLRLVLAYAVKPMVARRRTTSV